MELDMTQAITFSDVEDDAEKNKLPVAHLTILNHQSMKDKSFPIFRGKNIIGRQEHSCDICIPAKSLSKKHACIEVMGRSHLLYDMSSRNKSRRRTLFLTPEVRYELKHKDVLVFADISCKYTVEEIARASDSGSDTESMSDLEDKFEDVSLNIPAATKSNISLDLENSNSSSGSDILLPTQDFPNNDFVQHSNPDLETISPVKGEVLAVDSSPENQMESSYRKDRMFFQNNANKETNLDAEILAAATQAYVADSDDDANSVEYDTENPMVFIADTQPQTSQQSQKSNNDIPEDLPKEPNKLQLNSSPSKTEGSEGFKMKPSSEIPVNTKAEEKLNDDPFFLSTYKNDIEMSDTELSPVTKSPVTEPVTSTAHETLAESFQKPETSVDKNLNKSSIPANKSPGSKPSSTIIKSTVSSPVMDTIPVGSFQELGMPVDKTLKLASTTSTPIKETLPLLNISMDTVEVKEGINSEKQSQVAESLQTVAIEAFTETVCVQEDKDEVSSPTKEQTATTNPNLSTLISSPKIVHASTTSKTECSENFNLDATQPYMLESSFCSPNTKKMFASPKTPVDEKTQPLRQSCGLDVEMVNDNSSTMRVNTPVKNIQSESLVQNPKRSRLHSISSDEEYVAGTEEQNFKDKPVLENLSDDKSKNLLRSIPDTTNTLSGDIFASGKSSQTNRCNSNVTEGKGSGEPNTVILETLAPAVEEQTDLETRVSEKPNVTAVNTSRAIEEELPVELPDNEVSCDIEEDIVRKSKRLKKVAVPTPALEKGKKLPRKNTKTTDMPSRFVEIPEIKSREKRSLRNRSETSDSHSNDKKSNVRKSIRFDLPEEEVSSQLEKYSDDSSKNMKKSSNRSKKSATEIKDDKGYKKLSESSESNLADVKDDEYSEGSKMEIKSKIGRRKRIKKETNVIESEMEIDDDFVGKKDSEIREITKATENIYFQVKEENVGDISALSQNMDDSRKIGRISRGKSKQNKEKIQEEFSNSSNTTRASQCLVTNNDSNKDTPRRGRVSRSKTVKDEKEPSGESVLETDSNDTPTSRVRSTRGAKKKVIEDKGKSKKGGKVSLKKSSDSNKQCEEPCQENPSEESKNVNQKEDMEIDEAGDSKAKSNIEEKNTEDMRISQSGNRRNKRKKSEEEAVCKISGKNPKKKKIVSNDETQPSENSSCSLTQQSVPVSEDHAKNLSLSSHMTTDTTPSKTTSTKKTQSKRQLSHSQDTKEEASEKQELKTPGKRKENHRTASQSSNESSYMVTPKHLKSNQYTSPRRNSEQLKPNVMFTGLTDDKGQRIVTDLGGTVVTNYNCCTHLVTDKVRRTVKFLCCLARGIPIISLNWLTKCKFAKMFIDYTPFIVLDLDSENQYNFSLSKSLQLAQSLSPLKGYRIHVTKSVKPSAEQMKEIIESCKAKFLAKLPTEFKEDTIVISCEDDRSSCERAIQAGIPIVEAEFLLTGILQQDLSINKHQIFQTSPTNETCKQSTVTKSRSTRKTKK